MDVQPGAAVARFAGDLVTDVPTRHELEALLSGLSWQIRELAGDFAKHEVLHEREVVRRSAARKWWVMAAVAAIGAVDGPVVTLIFHVR